MSARLSLAEVLGFFLSTRVMVCVGIAIGLQRYSYKLLQRFVRLMTHTYFRHITLQGINYLPREGPVIICPNHPNMMVDAFLVLTEIHKLGRVPYVWAKASAFANPLLNLFSRSCGGVPVFRPPRDNQEVEAESTPAERSATLEKTFSASYDALGQGHCLVLFPEGTSYTKPHMLTLKTGVIRVASGFVTRPEGMPVTIVPCGINYFKKDRFRSEVVLEFGPPLVMDTALLASVNYDTDPRGATNALTSVLQQRMHDVTLNAPTMAFLERARAFRRLLLMDKQSSTPLSSHEELVVTRELLRILALDDASIQALSLKVDTFSSVCANLGISDASLTCAIGSESLLVLGLENLVTLGALCLVGLPGFLINTPFYILSQVLSRAAGYTESKSMFKMLGFAVLLPMQWTVLLLLVGWFYGWTATKLLMVLLPLLLYSHIRALEEGRSIVQLSKSLWHLGTRYETLCELQGVRQTLITPVQSMMRAHASAKVLALLQVVKKMPPQIRLARQLRVPSRSNF